MDKSNLYQLKPGYSLIPKLVRRFKRDKPSLIFAIGPTGAGKTNLLEKTRKLIFPSDKQRTFRRFLIDDYVEQSDSYKKDVQKIIKKFKCISKKTSPTCNLENPSQKLLKDFEKAYLKSRKTWIDIHNQDLIKAIKKKSNILIETTGRVIPFNYLQMLSTHASFEEYNIIFVYSIVKFNKLLERNKSRAMGHMEIFINNYKQHAPRLPDISPINFKKTTTIIESSLIQLRNICLRLIKPSETASQYQCENINKSGNFILLIFDNNEWVSKLIYDSRSNDILMTNSQFNNLLSSFNLSDSKGRKGSKKKNNSPKSKLSKKSLVKH